MSNRLFANLLLLSGSVACLSARADLSADQLKLLQDTGGWQYITMSEPSGGVQTTHTCFDGRPHPDVCSGTLTLTASKTFVQNVSIEGKSVQRHGTYDLDGDQLAFFDEYGTKDGPYTIELSDETKSLTLTMPQVVVVLELEKEYRRGTKPIK